MTGVSLVTYMTGVSLVTYMTGVSLENKHLGSLIQKNMTLFSINAAFIPVKTHISPQYLGNGCVYAI
jgi:hypothetical protein